MPAPRLRSFLRDREVMRYLAKLRARLEQFREALRAAGAPEPTPQGDMALTWPNGTLAMVLATGEVWVAGLDGSEFYIDLAEDLESRLPALLATVRRPASPPERGNVRRASLDPRHNRRRVLP